MEKLIIALFLTLFANTVNAQEYHPLSKIQTFRQAKEIAHKKIYINDLQVDYYCGCTYNRAKQIDLDSCGYQVRKNLNRAKRIEWEHVVPASLYGKTQSCWKDGGRKNCGEKSVAFSKFEGDLHNLRPVVGEVNGDRSNLPYNIVGEQFVTYGQCKFKIDFKTNVAEPPDEIKGDLARITLYLQEKYALPYSSEYIILMKGWAIADPVSEKEIKINNLIKFYQNDSNYYIDGSKQIK